MGFKNTVYACDVFDAYRSVALALVRCSGNVAADAKPGGALWVTAVT
jgi:hypothetical protein